jgi:cold shock CspA family protein
VTQLSSYDYDWGQIAEDGEVVLEVLETIDPRDYTPDSLDLCLSVEDTLTHGSRESADDYIASKLASISSALTDSRRRADPAHLGRRVGRVESLVDRGFGFLVSDRDRYFFHASSLSDRRHFDELTVGSRLAFRPGATPHEGKTPAVDVYWVA